MPIILVLLWPFCEIWLFIRMCGWIGAGNTLLLCVLSALFGGWLIARQGTGALMAGRRGFNGGRPAEDVLESVCIALAGVLFILPGFLSDIAAVFLLLPGTRKRVLARAFATPVFHATRQSYARRDHPAGAAQDAGDVIEGDYERLDDRNTEG